MNDTIPHHYPFVDLYPDGFFPVVAANVFWEESYELLLPSYVIVEAGGVRVAFIGAVTLVTKELSLHGNVAPFGSHMMLRRSMNRSQP